MPRRPSSVAAPSAVRSAPAQNALPAPVTMSACTSGSASAASTAARKAADISAVTALRRSGSLMVMRATRSSTWTSTGSDTRLSLVTGSGGGRQRDVVQGHRDVAGQNVHERRDVPYRGAGRDDIARKAGAAWEVVAPVPEPGRTLVREHAGRLVDAIPARLDERRRPSVARVRRDIEDTVAAIAGRGGTGRRGQRHREQCGGRCHRDLGLHDVECIQPCAHRRRYRQYSAGYAAAASPL